MRIVSALILTAGASSFVPLNTGRYNVARRQRQGGWTNAAFSKAKGSTRSSIRMMEEMEVIECDVAIVGGGPAGCTCALYTSRADLKTIILDKNPSIGALAITSHIANYPGVDKAMTGEELLDQQREQAIQHGADYRRSQVVLIDVEDGDGKKYSTTVYTPEATIKARSLVLATGAMGRVSPPFSGEDTYLGQGVSYCATCDGAFYRDSEVAVFGMNLEAMEEAMFLTKFASTVHWITPAELRASDDEHVTELLAQPNVKHWSKTRLVSVEGDVSGVTGVQIKEIGKEESEIIPVEGAFIYAAGGGSKPITDFVQNKVDFKEDGGVIVNEDMETSVKGVFAIGDIRNTSFKQVVVAASDGCIAAMSLDKYLKGRKSVKVDWIHK
jgi:thioredoxin reductase (NADPH)